MITVNLLLDNSFTVVSRETIYIGKYTWTYYQFHLDRYLQNLSNSTNILQLKAVIQNIPTYPAKNFSTAIAGINTVTNFLMYGINWIIYILNYILLAPIKILFYPVNIVMSLIGLNTSRDDAIQAFYLIYNLNIPYIPYAY